MKDRYPKFFVLTDHARRSGRYVDGFRYYRVNQDKRVYPVGKLPNYTHPIIWIEEAFYQQHGADIRQVEESELVLMF